MAPLNRIDALRASPPALPHHDPADDPFALNDFEAELERLSTANQELLAEFHHHDDDQAVATIAAALGLAPADAERLEMLRLENAELKARVAQLEALTSGD